MKTKKIFFSNAEQHVVFLDYQKLYLFY